MAGNVNLILFALIVCGGCGALAALVEPSVMRWLCAHGMAHAEALESYRRARVDNLRHWAAQLGRYK